MPAFAGTSRQEPARAKVSQGRVSFAVSEEEAVSGDAEGDLEVADLDEGESELEVADNPLDSPSESESEDEEFMEVELEDVPELETANEDVDYLASEDGSIELEMEDSGDEAELDVLAQNETETETETDADADADADADVEVDQDEMSYYLNAGDHSDKHMGEITIGSDDQHSLNDEIMVSDLDSHDDVEDMSLDSFEDEAEMVTELLDAPIAPMPVAKPAPAMEMAADESDEVLDLDDEAKLVSAALESESEIELSDDPEVEIEEELEFEESDMDEGSALMSEELSIHEPELLDSAEDLEADVPLLATEEAEIPELDEDLLQSNEIDTSVLDEVDDGEGEMSIEDEQRFENQIQASIEEDKKMRDDFEEDPNQSARADALRMLESASEDDEMAKDEEELSVLSAPVAPKPKTVAGNPKSSGQSFDFDGFDVTENTMRVHFSSGAYLDVQLDSLEMSMSKVFRMGRQSITVTHVAEGYTLEVSGMRMFYPHQTMRAAS